jgi:ferredoxin-NADP reductase
MKQWLDRVTGKVTMYRLAIICLLALAVAAFALSFLGLLFYSPLALLASGAVAVGVSYAANWLLAWGFRVRPHSDSAIITGLLLFFLFFPSTDAVDLSTLALTAVLAMASKYVLAWRGRHIFNPAAVGAVIIALTGWNAAIWWPATASLLPVVAVATFLILYRTRRLAFGSVFMVLAFVLVVGRLLLAGQDPVFAASTALASYPIVFLAGFMLSEPLTTPPRRWQQYLVAVVVALVFAIPFQVGPLYNSPEVALVAGNLVAFFFGQRRAIRLNYLGKHELGPTTWELSFQPIRPVTFRPGQYMELTLPHRKADFRGSRRMFSIASAPTPDGPITFAITEPSKPSSFKRALLDLAPGTEIRGTSVGGDFALPKDPSVPLLLVAGGIGITPFASQLAHAHSIGERRDVVVVYSISNPGQLPYADLLETTGVRVVLVAPEPPATLPPGWEYAGPGRITRETIEARVPDVAARRALVSGPPALVNDIRAALRALGSRRILTDYFSGY